MFGHHDNREDKGVASRLVSLITLSPFIYGGYKWYKKYSELYEFTEKKILGMNVKYPNLTSLSRMMSGIAKKMTIQDDEFVSGRTKDLIMQWRENAVLGSQRPILISKIENYIGRIKAMELQVKNTVEEFKRHVDRVVKSVETKSAVVTDKNIRISTFNIKKDGVWDDALQKINQYIDKLTIDDYNTLIIERIIRNHNSDFLDGAELRKFLEDPKLMKQNISILPNSVLEDIQKEYLEFSTNFYFKMNSLKSYTNNVRVLNFISDGNPSNFGGELTNIISKFSENLSLMSSPMEYANIKHAEFMFSDAINLKVATRVIPKYDYLFSSSKPANINFNDLSEVFTNKGTRRSMMKAIATASQESGINPLFRPLVSDMNQSDALAFKSLRAITTGEFYGFISNIFHKLNEINSTTKIEVTPYFGHMKTPYLETNKFIFKLILRHRDTGEVRTLELPLGVPKHYKWQLQAGTTPRNVTANDITRGHVLLDRQVGLYDSMLTQYINDVFKYPANSNIVQTKLNTKLATCDVGTTDSGMVNDLKQSAAFRPHDLEIERLGAGTAFKASFDVLHNFRAATNKRFNFCDFEWDVYKDAAGVERKVITQFTSYEFHRDHTGDPICDRVVSYSAKPNTLTQFGTNSNITYTQNVFLQMKHLQKMVCKKSFYLGVNLE